MGVTCDKVIFRLTWGSTDSGGLDISINWTSLSIKRDQAKLAYLSMQNNNISTISTKEYKRKENTRYTWFTQLGFIHGKVFFYFLQNISSRLQERNAKNPNTIQKYEVVVCDVTPLTLLYTNRWGGITLTYYMWDNIILLNNISLYNDGYQEYTLPIQILDSSFIPSDFQTPLDSFL